MLKKYLFSDAEKASVEREIEIQQVCLSHPATCEQQQQPQDAENRLHMVGGCRAKGDTT